MRITPMDALILSAVAVAMVLFLAWAVMQ